MKVLLKSISFEIKFDELNGEKIGEIEIEDLKAFKALLKKYDGHCIVDVDNDGVDFVVCVYDGYAE